MWVDVVCLRRDGVKLPQDTVQSTPPLRARLTMDTVVMHPPDDGESARRADVAQLWTDGSKPVRVLECAQVSRVGGDGLLVVGVEPAEGAGHAQAWWCRLVLEDHGSAGGDTEMLTEWHDTAPGAVASEVAQAGS
jgi:hypothetical protein